MDLHLPPKPGLWVPPRPAIIRTTDLPKSPAAARGIGHNGGPSWLGEERRHRDAMLMVNQFSGFGARRRASAPILTLAYVAEANSATTNITIPASAAIGDLAVLFQVSNNSSGNSAAPTAVTPSGWANLRNDPLVLASTSTGFRLMADYRVLTSGQPGSSITGMNGAGAIDDKAMLIFRPTGGTITGLTNIGTGGAEANANAPSTQTIALSGQSYPALSLGMADATSTVTPSGTLSTTGTVITSGFMKVGYFIYDTTTPADLTWGMADGGSNFLQSLGVTVQFT